MHSFLVQHMLYLLVMDANIQTYNKMETLLGGIENSSYIYIYFFFCFICSCTYGEYTVFPLMSLMPRQSVKAIVAYCRRFPQALVRLVDVETCELIFQC